MTTRTPTESPATHALTLPLDLRWPQLGQDVLHAQLGSGLDTGTGAGAGSVLDLGSNAPDHIGFALGWDCAHYRCTPAAPHDVAPSALHSGLLAGQAVFGLRTLQASRHVRTWLQLRLHAWRRGRSVEVVQVTPNYLQQIDVSHCPVTRERLGDASLSAASIDRVCNDAGYAAGNLAVMSRRANLAKAAYGFDAALQRFESIVAAEPAASAGSANLDHPAGPADPAHSTAPTASPGESVALLSAAPAMPTTPIDVNLSRAEWARVATLCSFVEPLTHAQACTLPMLLLPPNRLRLFNPVQALQAFVSLQLLKPGWAQRLRRFTEMLPGTALQRDFRSFFMSLLPRVLEAGKLSARLETRWAIEDAWRTPCVQQRWTRFACQLDAAQCEELLARAAAQHLATALILPLSHGGATDGWNLANAGYQNASAATLAAFAAMKNRHRFT